MQNRDMDLVYKIMVYLKEHLTTTQGIKASTISITGYSSADIVFNCALLTDTDWVEGTVSYDRVLGTDVWFTRIRWHGLDFIESFD